MLILVTIPYLSVPGNTANVFKWVELVARRHGIIGVVKVPDKDLGLPSARGEEVGLEGVKIDGSDWPSVMNHLFQLRSFSTTAYV